ncbi:MAG: VWA domain-containing protein [Candidatus Acidiferrales bacterium]
MLRPSICLLDNGERARPYGLLLFVLFLLVAAPAFLSSFPFVRAQTAQKERLPKPRELDKGIKWQRNPVTGELSLISAAAEQNEEAAVPPVARGIITRVQLVPVTCSVFAEDGTSLQGLGRENFRVYDDGVQRDVIFFSAPSQGPSAVALVIDASPSVLRDSEQMRGAASALLEALAPPDEIAIVDFSAHTYLQLPLSSDRELLHRALGRVDVRALLGDTGGSNIYAAVDLTAREVFARRHYARNAIVLFTDGQDSGLGLTLDPASALPQAGISADRLTFDDVAKTLAAADIQVFAISTENRPKVMTPEWLAAHKDTTLITRDARKLKIPPYTLYLAELARRSGGQLYFLREAQSLADTFRRIAERVTGEYWVGFIPGSTANELPHAGWHSLRVEVVGHPGAIAVHRTAYYVAATR